MYLFMKTGIIMFLHIHIPPNSNQDIWLKLENTFDMALNDNTVYIMAMGDFNENQLNTVQIPKLNHYWHNLV